MNLKNGCCAVIAAAGLSSRMGGDCSKQFISLLGVPAVIRTLLAFEAAKMIDSVVVVCREEDRSAMEKLVADYRIRKVSAIVPGGASRQESVAAGVAAAPERDGFLAIQDGARPLVTPEEIDACVRDCLVTGASALGIPVRDTVKIVDSAHCVVVTPDRSALWAVQTPQVFRRSVYFSALEQAEKDGAEYTDDCQLVEHLGVPVHLCPGSYENIKLTTSEDVCIAEAILRHREEKP